MTQGLKDFGHLADAAKIYSSKYILAHSGERFVYHDVNHTLSVVAVATQIAKHYKLEEYKINILQIAGYLHDVGYYTNSDNHELESCHLARSFLNSHDCPLSIANDICRVILSTDMIGRPKDILEQIIRDADLHYLGSKNYFETAELLRKEWELTANHMLSDNDWYFKNIHFFEHHNFFTDYAQNKFNEQKAANLRLIKNKLNSDV